MSGPSRDAQALLDRLRELADAIEFHEAHMAQLKHEQFATRAKLAASGYRPPAPGQQASLL